MFWGDSMTVKIKGSINSFCEEARDEAVFPLRVVASLDSGEITIYSVSEFKEIAEELSRLGYNEIFSADTERKISERAEELLRPLGFEFEAVFCTEYFLDSRDKVNKALILDSSEPLLSECEYENITDCIPDPNGEGLLSFGTLSEGKIVSCAVENPHFPTDTVIDIAVETAAGYEGRGFGASNVASLAYYLLDPEVLVTYTTEDTNLSSIRLAEKVGFEVGQRIFLIAAYK